MNLKKTAIALAVASVASAPIIAAADGSVYASARIGFEYKDTGGTKNTIIRNHSSRMGLKGETDLGNGMTAWGKYEFAVNATGGDNAGVLSRRHGVIGIKGDFGDVFIGQTYHTFYNYVVGPSDNPWFGSGYAMVSYTGRTGEAITYNGDFGIVSIGGTAYLANAKTAGDNNAPGDGTTTGSVDTEDFDAYELALGVDAGPVRLAFAVQDKDSATGTDPDPIYAFHLGGSAGGFSYSGGYPAFLICYRNYFCH